MESLGAWWGARDDSLRESAAVSGGGSRAAHGGMRHMPASERPCAISVLAHMLKMLARAVRDGVRDRTAGRMRGIGYCTPERALFVVSQVILIAAADPVERHDS